MCGLATKPKEQGRFPRQTELLTATPGIGHQCWHCKPAGNYSTSSSSSCVNLCMASSCRPQVGTRFGTRACACCRICVLLSVSRGLEPNKAKSAITTHHPVCGLQQIRFRSRFPSTNKQAATEATCIQLPCDGVLSVSQFPPELCPSIHLFPQGPHGGGPDLFFPS